MKIKYQISNNHILALSVGIIYLWFGALKYFPNVSPAEELVKKTINVLTFNLIPSNISIVLLAIGESIIGMLLIINIWRQTAIIIALIHMIFTFSPLFLFPELIFENIPFHLTLHGQYIFKNLIIIAGLLTLYKLPKIK